MPGLVLKIFFNKKFIFDCRGLWADERIDNKSWQRNKFFYNLLYIFFKYLEKLYLQKSDFTIVLTYKIKYFFLKNYNLNKKKLIVLPCVANFDKYKILNDKKIIYLKRIYKLSGNDLIIGYFGSISNIYMPNEMIDLFLFSKKYFKNPKIIFFSDNFDYLHKHVDNFKNLKTEDYSLFSPKEKDLCKYYNLCDLTLCFVVNSFARKASSPTKIGESLACGIPVLCNKNVGDIDKIIPKIYKNGLVNSNKKNEIKKLSKNLKQFKNINKKSIRNMSKDIYDSNRVNKPYLKIYNYLIKY
jgi:glycosyltransferase involved in cell wall biosynthesis